MPGPGGDPVQDRLAGNHQRTAVGDGLEIGFNVGYLQDVLGNLKNESIRMDFGDANTSALLTVPDDEQFKYVVMPMRI